MSQCATTPLCAGSTYPRLQVGNIPYFGSMIAHISSQRLPHFHTSMSQPSSASRRARCSWFSRVGAPPVTTGFTARRNAAGLDDATSFKAPGLISGRKSTLCRGGGGEGQG